MARPIKEVLRFVVGLPIVALIFAAFVGCLFVLGWLTDVAGIGSVPTWRAVRWYDYVGNSGFGIVGLVIAAVVCLASYSIGKALINGERKA